MLQPSPLSYRTSGNRKRSEQSMNAVHKSLKTVFLIAICRRSSDKPQSKTLFLMILYLRSSIVLTFSIAAYLKCLLNIGLRFRLPPMRCEFVVRFIMLRWTFLHTIEYNYLELLVLERKVYNNDDITFFSVY